MEFTIRDLINCTTYTSGHRYKISMLDIINNKDSVEYNYLIKYHYFIEPSNLYIFKYNGNVRVDHNQIQPCANVAPSRRVTICACAVFTGGPHSDTAWSVYPETLGSSNLLE